MAAPTNIRLHAHIEGQGPYPHDPRSRVGVGRLYATKEEIDLTTRYEGMLTTTDDGKLWMLRGGTANEDFLDLLGLFVTLATANVAFGYAALDGNGKLPTYVLPSLAIGNTSVVGNEIEMLALVAETGDIAKRTDEGKTYILQGADPTILGSWVDISSNFSGVESVNGKSDQHITLTADDIDETIARVWVSLTEKNTWNAKQDALQYDEAPTYQSAKMVKSGAIFDFLKQRESTPLYKSWVGSAADGNNRFHLENEDKDIDYITVFSEGGVIQHQGVHFSVDENKRYIQLNDAPDPELTYYLRWFANIPTASLTSVAVANVVGLLENGKVKEDLLPEGIGGRIDKPFNPDLLFDKNYQMQTVVAGAIAFTRNAGTEIAKNEAVTGKSTLIYMKANGINIPTFSSDFYIHSGAWVNTLNVWHTLYFNQQPDGKIKVIIEYQPLPA